MTNPFNFSDRDYVSLRNQLIEYLQNKQPDWSADPSDFALSILEGTAYIGDMMSYYVDRAAQESNILTANKASNIYALARLFGYIPGLAMSARTEVTFTNSNDVDVVIDRGTPVGSLSGGLSYELQHDVTVPAGGTTTGEVWEGVTKNIELGTSDGTGNQRFLLPERNVDGREGAFTVFTQNPLDPSIVEFWTPTELVLDSPSGDYVFSPTIYPDGSTYIAFGDGVAGRVPPKGWSINIYYRTTSGAAGNATTSISRFQVSWDDPALVRLSGISVSGENPTGGFDLESVDSIRTGTVNLTKTQRRAVTALDYESLIKADSRVLDAACESKVWSRPTIWIMPREFTLLSNEQGLASLLEQVEDAAEQAVMAGVSPDARVGIPVTFSVEIEVIAPPSVDVEYVAIQVQDAVYQVFSYEKGILGAPVAYDHIIRAISERVPQSVVQFARVLAILDEAQNRTTELTPLISELLYLAEPSSVVVTVSKTTSSGRTR